VAATYFTNDRDLSFDGRRLFGTQKDAEGTPPNNPVDGVTKLENDVALGQIEMRRSGNVITFGGITVAIFSTFAIGYFLFA